MNERITVAVAKEERVTQQVWVNTTDSGKVVVGVHRESSRTDVFLSIDDVNDLIEALRTAKRRAARLLKMQEPDRA